MSETSLHHKLKTFYAGNDGITEAVIDGYMIDVVKNDLLFEIQTKNFYSLKPKLEYLISQNQIRVIYPIALKRWITVFPKDGNRPIRKRKSPKKL